VAEDVVKSFLPMTRTSKKASKKIVPVPIMER